MKKTLLCIFLISCIFLSGCYSYQDINNVVFTTAIIFDIDNDNKPVVYLEIFKPAKTASKSAEKAERIVLKGTGRSVYEALNEANLASSFKIDFTQNKAIIYTKRAAQNGIKSYFDIVRRDSQFIVRPYVAVYEGDVDRITKGSFEEEKFVGLFLWDLIRNIGTSSRTIQSSLNHCLTMRGTPEKTDVLTVIKMSDDEPVPTLVVEGGAIMKDDKLKDMMPTAEGEAYNFITNQVASGSMGVNDLNDKSKYISLKIERSKTDTDISLQGGKFIIKKKINVKASIVETENYINLTDKEIKEIQQGAEKNLITSCYNVYNKYKKENLDIFMFGLDIANKYGDDAIKNGKNTIQDTQLEIEPHVFIDGPGKARGYK
jgi:spore germination protein KC